ncbi:MAG: hypothetical protein PHH54_03565 [Candidatus Nanoarchaeia archaeon]|nr:hypothetical protein [Candidatus Nanoarchaeia archaeon]MDD5741036.1 hypothetical protein [Candidatus Nanoarchaeia archaeon]
MATDKEYEKFMKRFREAEPQLYEEAEKIIKSDNQKDLEGVICCFSAEEVKQAISRKEQALFCTYNKYLIELFREYVSNINEHKGPEDYDVKIKCRKINQGKKGIFYITFFKFDK